VGNRTCSKTGKLSCRNQAVSQADWAAGIRQSIRQSGLQESGSQTGRVGNRTGSKTGRLDCRNQAVIQAEWATGHAVRQAD
jgi:hypothetical protein